MSLIRRHIFVLGRVQRVGFRFRTKVRAEQFNLSGWVRNLEDGRVEILVEGEEKNVKKLISWIKNQPIFSKVEKVEVSEMPYKGEFDGFEIIF